MTTPPFGRLVTALITVFDHEGGVDLNATLKMAKHCLKTGSDALVLAGTTGESPTLTFEEEERLFAFLRKSLPGATLIAGTGSNDTAAAVEHSLAARKLGMDGLLLVNPYYNRPQQQGLLEHFACVVNTARLPALLYNIPGRSAGEIDTPTLLKLAKNRYIVGVKECSGKLGRLITLANEAPGFAVYSGDDGAVLPMMAAGAVGLVGVASHVVGRPMKRGIEAMAGGHLHLAQKALFPLNPFFEALYAEVNPVGIKAALEHLGLCAGRVRLPLVAASEATRKAIAKELTHLGLKPLKK